MFGVSGWRRSMWPARGVHLAAIHQNLNGVDVGDVGGQGVDERIDREQLVERAARMFRRHLTTQVDEEAAVVGQIEGAQARASRERASATVAEPFRAAVPR